MTTDTEQWLTVAQVAEKFQVSPWTVYKRLSSGEWEAGHVGRSRRFSPEQVAAIDAKVLGAPEAVQAVTPKPAHDPAVLARAAKRLGLHAAA